MSIKPKEALLTVPIVLMFDSSDEIACFASNVNAILHGKQRLKTEELGVLGGRFVGIFYLERGKEYQELRDSFVRLIDEEEFGSQEEKYLPSELRDEDESNDYS
jgi:hypothetical protein